MSAAPFVLQVIENPVYIEVAEDFTTLQVADPEVELSVTPFNRDAAMLQTVPIAVHTPLAGEALVYDGAQWIAGAVPPGPPPAVTGTGFPHVTAGTWDPAAKVVENADVHAAAAIAWDKISKAGAVPADVGAAPAAEGVINGNAHDHVGGDGAQIDHGGLAGLADNDHPQYAPAGQGVTNGDAHDHIGGDGAQIDHTSLANKGTNTHAQVDTHLTAAAPHSGHEVTSAKDAANGYAGLDASILINGDQLPAMSATKKGGVPATGTPASKFLRDDATWQTVGGSVPTGTGFRHVVAGVEDAAAKLVENDDVAAAAAIAESKLALGYPTHSNANDPTAGEKAALPGTSGTPGAGNKYVTDADPRNSDARTPASHGIADAARHSSAATPGKALKADANGLPADATNTDAEVSAAVTASHAAVSLAADAEVLLGLSGQQITLDPQVANRVLAGPASGGDADPAFRTLVAGDVPDLSGTYAPASKGVTNGDAHDHAGGDGAQIDHGGLAGLADDDHPQYVGHALATAMSDFLVASGVGAFVKKTLAEVKTILGLGSAAYTESTDYAPASKGVTNGDAHDHVGGDGAQIDHGGLAGLADDDHTQYVRHSLATAVSDFLVASAAGAFVKKTLAEVKTILGLGALAYKSTVATADIDNDAVTYARMQNVSATDKVLGRFNAGAGDVEEIACTAAGRAIIDDADAAAQRTTLGLGTAATKDVDAASGVAGLNASSRVLKSLFADFANADGVAWGIITTGLCGETLAAKDTVYYKGADGRWWKAKGDVSATSGPVTLALVLSGGAAGAACTILIWGTYGSTGWGLTKGSFYYVSTATAGAITTTAPSTSGHQVRAVGQAIETTVLFFHPSPDWGEKS